MALWNELYRKLSVLLRRSQMRAELEEEMALHLKLREEQQLREGPGELNPQTSAKKRFGNVTLLREQSGDAWRFGNVEQIASDVRYALRGLRRTPIFTAVAVFTLALGIGANTAIFSVVNAVLLRPLGYWQAGRLVTLLHDPTGPVAPANYVDWKTQSHSFEAVGAAEYWTPNLRAGGGPAEHVHALHVTQTLLPMLGIEPLIGRVFAKGEDHKGSEHEVVLGYSLWQRRFGGDRNIVGRTIALDQDSYTVVGIMPAEFHFAPFWATHSELWAPLALDDRIHERAGNSLRVFARLKAGVTVESARAEIRTITARLDQRYPGTNRNVVVTPLKENVIGKVETPLLMTLAAVALLLLISCVNVAHMLLARTGDRHKEIAVRAALGAGRAHVFRQFLIESLVLASVGAAAGLALAYLGTRVLRTVGPSSIPRLESVEVDGTVMLFVAGVTVLAALIFGLAPAMRATKGNIGEALKEGGRGDSDGLERNRLRSALVISEFALAFTLLIGAGLMVRSFAALQAIDPGFDPHRLLTMVVSVAGTNEVGPRERRKAFYEELVLRVREMPGVTATGAINHLPLAGDMWGKPFFIEGRPEPKPGEYPSAVYRVVMPGYFDTMRIPMRVGRPIDRRDDTNTPNVAVVNERAVKEYFGGQNPIGKRFAWKGAEGAAPAWLTIVGVAGNAKQISWAEEPYPEVYVAATQSDEFLDTHISYITLVVRTADDAGKAAAGVKAAVWSLDRNLVISDVQTMEQVVKEANAQPRFEMMLFAAFGITALLLAAAGIYGVMSYSVSRRTREIGIRMSLGARATDVLRDVMVQGIGQAAIGAAIGLGAAIIAARLMAQMLYGVKPSDPVTFVGAAAVLIVTAIIAVSVPARKATRIDPVVALRNE